MTPPPDPSPRVPRRHSALELQPFDFSRESFAGTLEPGLPSDPRQGRVVAVRATSRARGKEWSAHAAVAIAGHWAARGARVLLVDLGFGEPHLHRAFGARNLEGVADAIEYGTSLRRIARPANDGAFWLATAGTPVADPRALLARPRWRLLLESLVGGGVTVLAYQPAESDVHPPGVRSIVLACKGEPMSALGKAGLRDAMSLLGPAPNGTSAGGVTGKSANLLGGQGYQASLWDGFDGEPAREKPAEEEAPREDPADGEQAAATGEPAAEALVPVDSGSGVPGPRRGLGASAFSVLILFAVVMVLMGINNAGIAEVPGATWLWELFERLLARISQLFV